MKITSEKLTKEKTSIIVIDVLPGSVVSFYKDYLGRPEVLIEHGEESDTTLLHEHTRMFVGEKVVTEIIETDKYLTLYTAPNIVSTLLTEIEAHDFTRVPYRRFTVPLKYTQHEELRKEMLAGLKDKYPNDSYYVEINEELGKTGYVHFIHGLKQVDLAALVRNFVDLERYWSRTKIAYLVIEPSENSKESYEEIKLFLSTVRPEISWVSKLTFALLKPHQTSKMRFMASNPPDTNNQDNQVVVIKGDYQDKIESIRFNDRVVVKEGSERKIEFLGLNFPAQPMHPHIKPEEIPLFKGPASCQQPEES